MAKRGVSALTEAMAQQIVDLLRAGHYRQTAAKAVGIQATTLSEWTSRKSEPYATLARRMDEAEAEAERIQLAKIVESAEPGDAKWYLARKFPDRWAETKRVDVSGRFETGIKLDAKSFSDPQTRQAIEILARAIATDSDADTSDAGPDSDE